MIYFALIIICTIKEASFNQLSCSCVYLPLCIWGVWLCNWFLRILSFLTLHLFLLLWLKILCFYFVVLFFKPPWFCIPYEGTGRWGEHPTAARAEGGEGAPSPRSQLLLLLFLLPSTDTSMKGTRPGLIFVISTKSQVMGFAVWQQLVTCLDCFLENRRDAVI